MVDSRGLSSPVEPVPSSFPLDAEGLVFAIRLDTCKHLGGKARVLEATAQAPLWIHFNLSDNRARRHLEKWGELDEDGRALLLDGDAQVRLLLLAEGFGAVLGDFHTDFDLDPEAFGKLRVYVDSRVIITCRQHALAGVDRVRRRLEHGETAESPVELFERLVREIAEGFASVSVRLGEIVEDAEDEVLAGRLSGRARELGSVRRLLARLRRHGAANKNALQPLPDRIAAWSQGEQRQRLREVIERLDAVGQDLELVTERARLVQEEIAGRLGEATNKNLYLLSTLTTALLPITLITGIFGMNVGGLPFLNSPHGFWVVMFVITAAIAGVMLSLRRRGVF